MLSGIPVTTNNGVAEKIIMKEKIYRERPAITISQKPIFRLISATSLIFCGRKNLILLFIQATITTAPEIAVIMTRPINESLSPQPSRRIGPNP